MDRLATASVQSDLVVYCPLSVKYDYIDLSKDRSDLAYARVDMELHGPHMACDNSNLKVTYKSKIYIIFLC